MDVKSHYASAERSSKNSIKQNFEFLESDKMFLDMFASISGVAAILDENRQIVYANEDLLNLLGVGSLETILGKRPGEVVSCIHSSENPNGCGTAEACRYCGAVNAILTSQRTNQKSTNETRITSEIEGKTISWDLKITSAPLKIKDKQFYVFTLQDISGEKRKENLERSFFHDLLNTAGSLNGLLKMLKDGTTPDESKEIINLSEEASRDLLEEIILHRQIKAAEDGDLKVNIQLFNSLALLKSAIGKIEGNEVALEKIITVEDTSPGTDIRTDRILLLRVLLNMLKNALEATEKGGTVTAKVIDSGNKVRFQVKNDMVMSKEVQLQVFQRSFSTKGDGRGVGTYSIKLLTENYLKGKAGFISTESDGTVFFVDLFKSSKENNIG
jgi:K+-sensing histidine kinase KdpD